MMDEKKIEEAADKFAQLERIYFNEYYPMKNGFKAGINWFNENLWHDASEEPKMYKGLLVEYQDKSVILLTYSRKGTWNYVVNRKIKKRWLYIEDLMKGGK